jgi:predicted ATPase/class 3 adenylate cyclase
MSDRGTAVIRTPDQRLRAFVSSTLNELADERAAARDAILQLHLAPVLFELGARPHPPRDLYRAYLDQSHIFVGIYWQRYGWIAPGEKISGLEDEYLLSGDRPKLIYTKEPATDREPRLNELLGRIRSDDTACYRSFTSAIELRELIEADLMLLLSERFETPIDRSRPSGTVTFLFTDIEGSSDLAQRQPDAFPALLARHHEILHQAVEGHGGFVFQIVGDAFCVAFDSALDALNASVDAQHLLHEEPWTPAPIKVRMGMNTGMARAGNADDRSGGYTGYSTLARVQRVMSAGHGGQVLLANTTAEQARRELPTGVTLRDLGEHRLKGLVDPEHLWQVVAPGLPQSFPPLQTLGNVPSNLPVALDRFVGRTHELEEVKARLGRARLLTLLGTGGTGKTRLALQAAADLRDEFEDRVYFIDLASSRDLQSVLSVTAQAIGLRERSNGLLLDDLKGQIRAQKMLLLLDNFEQVTVAAPAMAELLRDCPELRQLVTSRAVLHVIGENVFPVPPLALPEAEPGHVSVEQLAQSEAIQLFVERAQAVKADFRLTEDNASAVAELCLRLDGLPLAIELATARLGLFSPRALVDRLGSRLKLLRGGARDAPARQQTLRDTIDWSYGMLDEGEQRLFELLAVFSGATFEAVEDVAGRIDRLQKIDVLDGLSALVDKSLIRRVDQSRAESRLVMLETIREFAAGRLEEDPEFAVAARRAHATYFADSTERRWEQLTGDRRDAASEQMAADIENIRAAWRYWVAEDDFAQLSKMTDSLWLLYDARGWYHATVSLTTDLLHVLSATPSTPERALEQIALQTGLARVLLALKGYTQEVEDAYTRALELFEGGGETRQLIPVLRGLSSLYIYRAEFEKGARAGEQILSLAERYDDESARVEGHLVLGANLALINDLESGLAHLEEGIAAYDPERYVSGRFQLGNNPGVVCRTTSALVLWMLGYPDRARDRADDSIDLAKRLDHPSSMAYALFHAGLIHLWRREGELAHGRAQAVLDIAEEHEFPIWTAVGSCLRGAALSGMGSADEGLALIERAMNTYQRLKTPPVFWPLLLYLQAGACGVAGRPGDGLRLLDEAVDVAAQSPGKTLWSEFFWLKGDLLLAVSPDNAAEAESWLQNAVNVAAEVRAPMLQLRAALRLARLWREQGRTEQARTLLSDAYEQLTEGFTTVDLREAKALLDDLA